MKRTALGFRMHSGWGVLVAVFIDSHIDPPEMQVVERRRIVIADGKVQGAIQPYHYAASLKFEDSKSHLANCTVVSESMARAAIEQVIHELAERGYRVVESAVLLASGRPLPSLEKILGSHPLIHTAEGEFFRNSVRSACERLHIPVETIREREVEDRVQVAFGTSASQLRKKVESAGRAIGPPWTKDHKVAALAALIVLSQEPATRPEVHQGT